MKKLLYIMIAASLLLAIIACRKKSKTGAGDMPNSFKAEQGIKGDVQNMRYTRYTAQESFGDIVKNEIKSDFFVVFDNNGYAEEFYDFDKNGKLTFKGWSESEAFMDEGVSLSADGSITQRHKYEHDDRGNMLEKWDFAPDGTVLGKTIRSYDGRNNLTELSYYDNDGTMTGKTIYTYNSEGKLVEEKKINENGYQESHSVYEYNIPQGLLNPKGKASDRTDYDADNVPSMVVEYLYNLEGDLLSSVNDNFTKQSTFTYEYEYDQNKNWTRRVEKRNSVVIEVTERQFNISKPAEAAFKTHGKSSAKPSIMPSVFASSARSGYPASNVLDGNPSTAWVAQEAGFGFGEYLHFDFLEPTDISNIVIMPGYNKSEESWTSNNRLKEIYIELSDGSVLRDLKFDGKLKSQAIAINKKDIEWIRLNVFSTHPGSKWKDTCVSEVSFY